MPWWRIGGEAGREAGGVAADVVVDFVVDVEGAAGGFEVVVGKFVGCGDVVVVAAVDGDEDRVVVATRKEAVVDVCVSQKDAKVEEEEQRRSAIAKAYIM